jgi:hypothetical protein
VVDEVLRQERQHRVLAVGLKRLGEEAQDRPGVLAARWSVGGNNRCVGHGVSSGGFVE